MLDEFRYRYGDGLLDLGLALLIVYGVASGQLGHRNPWDAGPAGHASTDG